MSDDIYLVSENLAPIRQELLDLLPEKIGHSPLGYVDYLERFGEGSYCDFLEIAEPSERLDDLTAEFRELEPEYVEWLTNYPSDKTPRFSDAFCIGRSFDGDMLVAKTGFPIHVFPRHDDSLYVLPAGLSDPLYWERVDPPNRQYNVAPPFRYFEPDCDRLRASFFTADEFDAFDVHKEIISHLPAGPVRHFSEVSDTRSNLGDSTVIIAFARSIQGRIQLCQTADDRRVSILFSYDLKSQSAIDVIAQHFKSLGFYSVPA